MTWHPIGPGDSNIWIETEEDRENPNPDRVIEMEEEVENQDPDIAREDWIKEDWGQRHK